MQLLNTEISLIEWSQQHWYKVVFDGATHWCASVTTKIGGTLHKEGLDRWRGDIGNREADMRMNEASNRGKRIHAAYETFLKGGTVIYDPWEHSQYTEEQIAEIKKQNKFFFALRNQDEMYDLYKLQRQFQILRPRVLAVEARVFDLENRDAGTIDNVLEIEGGSYAVSGSKPLVLEPGIYINDLKTGSFLDDNVWLQLAPYAKMYEAISGLSVKGALVTHTGAKTRSGIRGLTTLFRDRETLFGSDYSDYRHASSLWERKHKDEQPETFTFPNLIKIQQEQTFE